MKNIENDVSDMISNVKINTIYNNLGKCEEEENHIKIGIIGAGKFSTMFLAQAIQTKGFHIVAVGDLVLNRIKKSLITAGFSKEQMCSKLDDAISSMGTWVTEDCEAISKIEELDILVEATGNPESGVLHSLNAFDNFTNVVLVTVEADVLCGPMLAKIANQKGVILSMAYGDQPALICEMIDKVKTSGFEVVYAGKGTKYLPVYHESTPEKVWDFYGLSNEEAKKGNLNPKMFNSFLDGTKSSIEMAAVSNSENLMVPKTGLAFPAIGVSKLAEELGKKSIALSNQRGSVEVVSSMNRDGTEILDHLRFGVFVVFKASTEYVKRCFYEYGISTDIGSEFAAIWRPVHLIGLELGVSIASVHFDKRPTGSTVDFIGDVVAVAKRNLVVGEHLDGEGGETVWGRLSPSSDSLFNNALPIGLSHNAIIIRNIKKGEVISWQDVKIKNSSKAFHLRKKMERDYRSSILLDV